MNGMGTQSSKVWLRTRFFIVDVRESIAKASGRVQSSERESSTWNMACSLNRAVRGCGRWREGGKKEGQ